LSKLPFGNVWRYCVEWIGGDFAICGDFAIYGVFCLTNPGGNAKS